jgi:hypothetical protein
MIRTLLITTFLLWVILAYHVYADNIETTQEIPSIKLPTIVIAYNLFCSYYNEFKTLEPEHKNILIRLGRSLDQLNIGISTRLALTSRTFIIENIEDHFSGFPRVHEKTIEESKIPFDRILFVTTPIESFNNRILLILSSVSPERTTIISVDKKLHTELLYDSFVQNNNIEISSIYFIRVLKPGRFWLETRIRPSYREFYKNKKNRTFILEVGKTIEIQEKY